MATAATNLGVASAFKLKDAAEYEVKRDLLEKSYPAFKSFKGLMHAGMVPAAFVDESTTDDYSSYFFWLLRPDIESSPSDFRDDTLLVWLNGGPGCSSMTGMLGGEGGCFAAITRDSRPLMTSSFLLFLCNLQQKWDQLVFRSSGLESPNLIR